MKLIHTADWQLGKPFAAIRDQNKRSLVQAERINALRRMARIVASEGASLVVVAGDIFDSPSADKATVSRACEAIGKLGVPVFAIPGNHDHGGAGSLWHQEFFLREQRALAPNFTLLDKPEPIELDSVVILPCPLLRRSESADPTEWLRNASLYGRLPANKPRMALAHGTTQDFGYIPDDDDIATSSNRIALERLPLDELDYIALGDWHGMKQVAPKAWYAGTPESDRFPKGEEYASGMALVVEMERGRLPKVGTHGTGGLQWLDWRYDFAGDESFASFQAALAAQLGPDPQNVLLNLALTGSLGIEASRRLDQALESLEARLLRVKLRSAVVVAPTPEEIMAMTRQVENPLIASVAQSLVGMIQENSAEAGLAAVALRELHAACVEEGGR